MKHKPIIVGLTGGVGSGKTEATLFLRKKGFTVIDADEISHSITQPGMSGYQKILKIFGNGVLNSGSEIDRKKLGELVFNDETKRKQLESILHPLILTEIQTQIAAHQDESIIFVSIPLLIETGSFKGMNCSLLIYAPQDIQLQRLITHRKLPREYAEKILAAQIPIKNKQQRVDYVVDNSGTLEELHNNLEKALKKLCDQIDPS